MSRQMVNHRGPEFAEIMARVSENLKKLFQTRNDVLVLTGSGTAGMEAAVVNTMSPGDKVLAVSVGNFGERFASIAKTFGAEVIPLDFEWGKPADPDAIRQSLSANPDIKVVLVTHNETSTGITNDIQAISQVVKASDKLLVVDAISGIGSINLPVDEWHCDVVIAGSQKGWMCAPGVSMISVSEEAWQANAKAKMPRFYWDLARAKRYLETKQTPWTPAVSVIYGLDVGLQILLREGLSNVFARHARIGKMTREGVKELGLSPLADEKYASNTVTAVVGSKGLDVEKMRQILNDEYNIVVAGGQRKLAGKIFRIGHMGLVNETDIQEVLAALKLAIPKASSGGVQ